MAGDSTVTPMNIPGHTAQKTGPKSYTWTPNTPRGKTLDGSKPSYCQEFTLGSEVDPKMDGNEYRWQPPQNSGSNKLVLKSEDTKPVTVAFDKRGDGGIASHPNSADVYTQFSFSGKNVQSLEVHQPDGAVTTYGFTPPADSNNPMDQGKWEETLTLAQTSGCQNHGEYTAK